MTTQGAGHTQERRAPVTVVYPAIYEIWKWRFGLKHELALAPQAMGTPS